MTDLAEVIATLREHRDKLLREAKRVEVAISCLSPLSADPGSGQEGAPPGARPPAPVVAAAPALPLRVPGGRPSRRTFTVAQKRAGARRAAEIGCGPAAREAGVVRSLMDKWVAAYGVREVVEAEVGEPEPEPEPERIAVSPLAKRLRSEAAAIDRQRQSSETAAMVPSGVPRRFDPDKARAAAFPRDDEGFVGKSFGSRS